MPRYIDADALIQDTQRVFCEGCNNYNGVRCRACGVNDAISMIDCAPSADVVPKSEVAEIFNRLEGFIEKYAIEPYYTVLDMADDIAELKKKYCGNETKVSSHDICVVCGEHVPEGRQICSMCETGQEFLNKKKE